MKKKLAVVLACVMLCMLVIVGCGGNKEGLAGTSWKLTSGESSGVEIGEEMISSVIGEMSFSFQDGEKFSMSAMGATVEGTYKLDGSKLSLTIDGETMEGEYSSDKIVLEQDGVKLNFTKK